MTIEWGVANYMIISRKKDAKISKEGKSIAANCRKTTPNLPIFRKNPRIPKKPTSVLA